MAGSLFSDAFGGGISTGSLLRDTWFKNKQIPKYSQLEQLFKSGDYNNAGAMLAGMGQVGHGVNTLNIPYEREQQALQRDFQNQTFMDNRDFRNQQAGFQRDQAARDDEFRRMNFDILNQRDQRDFGFNSAKTEEQLRIEREKLAAAQNEAQAKANAPDIDNEVKLSKDFQALTEDYRNVRDAYTRIETSAKDPSPAGDMALIFNFMKALDPGSVVRESEFALAAQSGSYGDQIQAAVNKVINGERLAPNVRADFVNRGKQLHDAALRQYQKTEGIYRERASSYKLDPNRVVMDFTRTEGDPTQLGTLAPLTPTAGPRDAATNQKPVNVPSPQNAGRDPQNAVPVSNEQEAESLPVGSYFVLNGRVGRIK